VKPYEVGYYLAALTRLGLAFGNRPGVKVCLVCLGAFFACSLVAFGQDPSPTPTPPTNDPALLEATNYLVSGLWFLCGLVFVGIGFSRVRV